MGTSAYDWDRFGALPEIDFGEEAWQQPEPEYAEVPPVAEPQRRPASKRATRQRTPVFGIFAALVIGMLLVMVVLSHMELAMVSSEIGQLDREANRLRAEEIELQVAHDRIFGSEMEQFAREELGMVEAARGQIVLLSNGVGGDFAEVLRVPEEEQTVAGFFDHLRGLTGTLRDSWGSIFGR